MTQREETAPPGDISRVHAIVGQVRQIVERVTNDSSFEVHLFGSRVFGRARPRSDIDVAIDGPRPVDPTDMTRIREESERLPTLFTIDLVDLARVSPEFREAVRRQIRVEEP